MAEVIVIGGGAAGMLAAYTAAKNGAKVTLLEKNEKLGKKLFITGKGRCNVTNAADMEQLFANVCTNEKFLYSAFYQFDNRMMMDLLESAGCRLKVERGDRVFPVSDHSSDVIAALGRLLSQIGVKILLHTTVKQVLTEDISTEASEPTATKKNKKSEKKQALYRVIGVVLDNGRKLSCDSCIVCTGGLSYPSTGSTGDGYVFAKALGHQVTECKPALVPLETEEQWCEELMGLALKNVSLRLEFHGKEIYEGFGEMLFTHFGVSGPLVLSASSIYAKYCKGDKAEIYIDLKPALDEEQLDKRLLRDFEENKNKQFKNALGGLFPARLIPVMIQLSGIHPDKKVNEISKEERKAFIRLMKNLPLNICGSRSFAEAIITQGGVAVKHVNPSTMESKFAKGLYFAGEVLDLDAMTGGFNLQIAWSTGYLAGESAATA